MKSKFLATKFHAERVLENLNTSSPAAKPNIESIMTGVNASSESGPVNEASLNERMLDVARVVKVHLLTSCVQPLHACRHSCHRQRRQMLHLERWTHAAWI
jgi:hypothetical protein